MIFINKKKSHKECYNFASSRFLPFSLFFLLWDTLRFTPWKIKRKFSWGKWFFIIFLSSVLFWQEREILNTLMVPAKVFLALISTLEDHYVKDNPFHNSLHAADVTQSTNVLLNTPALENVFTPLEICAALFAACVHDVDHPGLTNQFLINSSKLSSTFLHRHASLIDQFPFTTNFLSLFLCRLWTGNYV